MTISTTTTRVAYTGDGVTTAFTVPFPFFTADELEVIERDAAAGGEILRVLGAHYTVAGGDGGAGTVTATSPPSAAVQWVIRRRTARVQETDYTPNDPFPADTHEKALDRLTMIGQELGEESDRALKIPKTDAATLDPTLPGSVARAGRVLAFDEGGAPAVSAKTLAELESGATDAAASAAAALASQSAAAASAAGALASKNAAVLSETNAATSALAAEAAAASVGFSDVVFVTAAQSPIAITAAHSGRLYNCDTSGGAIAFTLPKISTLTLPFTVGVKKTTADANAVTIDSDAADAFDDGTTSKVLASQFGTTLIPDVDPNPDSWTAADWAGAAIPDGAITTAKIADNAVTNAKSAQMAANTIKGNNTGATATAADVNAATMGASLVLIQAKSASNSATIDFTTGIDFTYDEYIFEITSLIPATDATGLYIRVSEDAGATWKSGASDYGWTRYANADGGAVGAAGAASDAQIIPCAGIGNGTGENVNATMKLRAPSGATYKIIGGQVDYYNSTPATSSLIFTGVYKGSVNAITGVRFLMNSGNIASGKFKLYGVRKS